MDWIFDNIQFVIAFAAAFAWWLNKRRESAGAEDEAPPPLMGETDAESEERARRIQEEIRRKIAERNTLPPVAPPPVVIPEWARAEPPRMEEAAPPVRGFDPGEAVLERQRELEEKLRLIEATRRRAAVLRTSPVVAPVKRSIVSTGPRLAPAGVLAGLRNPAEIRRAIVMREILGPPKGLQA